jgi:glucans biosynthesis protein
MHGGAPGSGAPRGNKNAFKHGHYAHEAIAQRRQIQELLRQSRKLLSDVSKTK